MDQASDALGAPRVRLRLVSDDFNAWCSRVGARQRPTLCIGIRLWAALSPDGRLALLGHELGHLVNGDPTRGFRTQPATTTFGRLAVLFDPRRQVHPHLAWPYAMAMKIVLMPFHLIFRELHIVTYRIASQDQRKAEVYATLSPSGSVEPAGDRADAGAAVPEVGTGGHVEGRASWAE